MVYSFMSSRKVEFNLFAMSLLAHQFQLFLLCLTHPLLSYISQQLPRLILSIPFGVDSTICWQMNTLIRDTLFTQLFPILIILSCCNSPFTITYKNNFFTQFAIISYSLKNIFSKLNLLVHCQRVSLHKLKTWGEITDLSLLIEFPVFIFECNEFCLGFLNCTAVYHGCRINRNLHAVLY